MNQQEFNEAVNDLKEFYGKEIKRVREYFQLRSRLMYWLGFAGGIIASIILMGLVIITEKYVLGI